jgi:hypothetical protein
MELSPKGKFFLSSKVDRIQRRILASRDLRDTKEKGTLLTNEIISGINEKVNMEL